MYFYTIRGDDFKLEKNGFIQNHKYMTGTRILQKSPAWVIMTNYPLDWEKMTKDRWMILQPQSDGTGLMKTFDEYWTLETMYGRGFHQQEWRDS